MKIQEKVETKLDALCKEHSITCEALPCFENPTMFGGDWPAGACHWSVRLSRRGTGNRVELVTWFSQGAAHRAEPSYGERVRGYRGRAIPPAAAEVLSCLISDAQAGEQSFGDYCDGYGINEDSRQALRTWEACVRTAKDVWRLLGAERAAFEEAAAEY